MFDQPFPSVINCDCGDAACLPCIQRHRAEAAQAENDRSWAEFTQLRAEVRALAKRQEEDHALEQKRLKLERRAQIRALRRAGLEIPAALLHQPGRKRGAGDPVPRRAERELTPEEAGRVAEAATRSAPKAAIKDIDKIVQAGGPWPAAWCTCACRCCRRHVEGERCPACMNGRCTGRKATVARLDLLRTKYRPR